MKDNNPNVTYVTLKGERRALKYTLGSFRKAERLGVRVTYNKLADPAPGDVVDLLLVGLLSDYPKLRPTDVEKIVEEDDDFDHVAFIGDVVPEIVRALGIDVEDRDPFEEGQAEEEGASPLD